MSVLDMCSIAWKARKVGRRGSGIRCEDCYRESLGVSLHVVSLHGFVKELADAPTGEVSKGEKCKDQAACCCWMENLLQKRWTTLKEVL